MQRNMRQWVVLTAILGLGFASGLSQAQDYPTHKGSNQRVSHNADPFNNSPGVGNLRWWHPDYTEQDLSVYIRDNTSSLVTRGGVWTSPLTANEASYPFIPTRTGDAIYDATVSSTFDSTSPRYNIYPITPGYQYAFTTPSKWSGSVSDYDPTVPTSGVARTYTWNVTPSSSTAGMYGVYVWLPTGPTTIGINPFYTQRYFVYKVAYGNGKTFTDVVDTTLAGSGWVRLGGGGAVTERGFEYDGTHPLTVTLYNTTPRDANGALLVPTGSTFLMVYADAAMSAPIWGSYSASPIVSMLTGATETVVLGALNQLEVGTVGSTSQTYSKGVVTSYVAANGTRRWSFSPLDESSLATNLDMPSAQVTVNPPDWSSSTTASNYMGANYYSANLVATQLGASDVAYKPNLADGDYDIYVWVAGSSNGETFGSKVAYEIDEGTTQTSTVFVNQDTNHGWVKLGNRRYAHSSSNLLVVHALNYSDEPSDIIAGDKAYADAVRFVGAGNLAIKSTPVHVNNALIQKDPNLLIPPVATDVDIVAAEDGRIYCLDSVGNGDGTTTVYWAYPSVPDKTNASWTDPNQVSGLDGEGGIAEMPTNFGFDLSSGLVERIDGKDLFYIAARNGRVYCIDVAGRGDFNATSRKPGTTSRVWSYPDDYPATAKTSNLGAFTGSVAFATTTDGPTVFVPAPQGRIYALDARPHSNRTTTVRWQYPLATSPTLGRISMTPSIDFGNVYFGTQVKEEGDNGEFYALNMNTGAVVWKFDGTATIPADDFVSSPATVGTALFTNPVYPQADTVFVANENRHIYALDATGNGDGTTNIIWSTNELSVGVSASLSFIPMQVYTTTGSLTASSLPVLMVPTNNGQMSGLFADGLTNRFGTKRAWQYDSGDAFVASVANGRGWMYGANTGGYLLAFNAGSGFISPGNPPGQWVIVENDASADIFRQAKIKFVDKPTYLALRAGTLDYAGLVAATEVTGSPLAFEWGETMYPVVYNFPHAVVNTVGAAVAEPTVNFAFSVEGSSTRTVTVASRAFVIGGAGNPPVSAVDGTTRLDGYAALSFPIQPGGGMALAPGDGLLTFSLTTGSLNSTGARQTVAMDTTTTRKEFKIANPLALLMNGASDLAQAIGYTNDPKNAENLVNGNPRGTVGTKTPSRLTATTKLISHGSTGFTMIDVVDRSLMTLLYGPDRGLSNVRVLRNDLRWNGGWAAVYKPLNTTLYPDFEDLPTRFPNDSLDYPDVSRERVTYTKDPNVSPENPVFSGVNLYPPTISGTNYSSRTLISTPFKIQLDVPKFQPFNVSLVTNSAGNNVNAGYIGQQVVYVDNGTGTFTRTGGQRNAYRTFRFGGNVDADERLSVSTPTVDMGSLAQGALYSPLAPSNSSNLMLNPLAPVSDTYFRTFKVVNEGNVNLRNLRLAKAQQFGGTLMPWPIYSQGNHESAWLETATNVFSNLDDDTRWNVSDSSGNVHHEVALQKARPGDRVGTELSLNPKRRANPNLTFSQDYLANTATYGTNYLPSIAVSIPIGFPVGAYSQVMRIINEDSGYPANNALSMDATGTGLEPYSDPTFILKFLVREARLTNSSTKGTATMVDSLVSGNELFLHANAQPTAMRTPSGGLIAAWASTRDNWDEVEPGANAKLDSAWRIYVAHLAGQLPTAISTSTNPLRDLGGFIPNAANRWFEKLSVSPFPTCTTVNEANALFDVDTANGQSVLLETVKFGSPSLPTSGLANPLTGAINTAAYMAFVGEAQVQTTTGRGVTSRLFMAPVTINGTGVPTVGTPVMAGHDDGRIPKSKPSVIQVGDYATFVFGGGGAGKSQLMYMTYDPTASDPKDRWSPIRSFSTGNGFEYATSPSVSARRFLSDAGGSQLPNGKAMLEILFVGKIRGSANSEVFLGRVPCDANGVPDGNANNPTFAYLPIKDQGELQSTDVPGVFRAEGVGWDLRSTIKLEQIYNNVTTDLEVAGTRTYDQATGLISFTTKLGGKVYLDAGAGTVRFSSVSPSNKAELVLTYRPRFLRISSAGLNAGHSAPSILFDNRLVAETSYWVGLTPTDGPSRYVFTYVKSARGVGATARPFMKSVRLGIQLPYAIATQD